MSTIDLDGNPSLSTATEAPCVPEQAVLNHLLDHHPRRLTTEELAREIGTAFEEAAIHRAVKNLAAADLVTLEDDAPSPSAAVVAFDRLPILTKF